MSHSSSASISFVSTFAQTRAFSSLHSSSSNESDRDHIFNGRRDREQSSGERISQRGLRHGQRRRRRQLKELRSVSQSSEHLSCSDAENFDVICVGAGHAGCEAALASARVGARTLLLTLSLDKIAWQPCNPAIGGPAKSQVVHEIDALGGAMGKIADKTYLQKRVLNSSRGPAVWALRAQTDKWEYSNAMRVEVESNDKVFIREGMVTELLVNSNDECVGVETHFGMQFHSKAVVLTTGTFMNGKIWVGRKTIDAGRAGEGSSVGLTEHLKKLGFETDRLKTGTPARVDGRTIDYTKCEEQKGDEDAKFFSFDPRNHLYIPQMSCYLTRTTKRTHDIIRENLHETPTYGGWASSKGPRYCPSIEDKIVKFAEKESHQIFLEPEGRKAPEIYVQGFSTGLPERLQLEPLRTLPGLENATMMRPAYAVEYDYLPAHQCTRDLQTKKIANLFFSGQINGTTGYEEAAGQGLVAGANAAAKALGTKPLILEREGSYLGTLIDDLVTKDLREPYRMLTSRSEYRLALRSDNADVRLTPIGRDSNLVDDERFKMFQEKSETIENELVRLHKHRLKESDPLVVAAIERSNNLGYGGKQSFTLEELLRRPGVTYDMFVEFSKEAGIDDIPRRLTKWEAECVEIRVKFAGFIQRQKIQIDRDLSKHGKEIPKEINYKDIPMRLEAREKLEKIQPATIGQASRIGGVTPADSHESRIDKEQEC